MFKDFIDEREGARVLPVWYVGMRRLHGISNFFVELLNLLSDYLQRPRAQEAQQIFVIRSRFPEVSLSFRNSHLPGSFPWKPARGGFLCHALAAALPNHIQGMWENEFCNQCKMYLLLKWHPRFPFIPISMFVILNMEHVVDISVEAFSQCGGIFR